MYYYRRRPRRKKFIPSRDMIDKDKIVKVTHFEKLDNHLLNQQIQFYENDLLNLKSYFEPKAMRDRRESLKENLKKYDESCELFLKECINFFKSQNFRETVTYWIDRKISIFSNRTTGWKDIRYDLVYESSADRIITLLDDVISIRDYIIYLGKTFLEEKKRINKLIIENEISKKVVFDDYESGPALPDVFNEKFENHNLALKGWETYVHQPTPPLHPWKAERCTSTILYAEANESSRNSKRVWNDSKNIEVLDKKKTETYSKVYFEPVDIKKIKDYEKVIEDFYRRMLRKIELVKRAKFKQTKKKDNLGTVYLLSNPAYKDPVLYKIGSTYQLVEERIEELSGETGVAYPFKLEFKIKIQDAEYFEKLIHKLLKDYRFKKNKEYFILDKKKIQEIFKTIVEISNKGTKRVKLDSLKKLI